MTMPPNVGDRVHYVPHVDLAKDCNPRTGDFPWEWELEVDPASGKKAAHVKTLTQPELLQHLSHIGAQGRAGVDVRDSVLHTKKLRPKRPTAAWPARVVSVNEDGTLGLHVHWWSETSGVVHGEGMYARVPHDPEAETGHSWHTEQEREAKRGRHQ